LFSILKPKLQVVVNQLIIRCFFIGLILSCPSVDVYCFVDGHLFQSIFFVYFRKAFEYEVVAELARIMK